MSDRIEERRSRLVYIANQAAHMDGEGHKAVREFIYAVDAALAAAEAREQKLREAVAEYEKALRFIADPPPCETCDLGLAGVCSCGGPSVYEVARAALALNADGKATE